MEVVGIDLGTTNSAIAHIDRDGRPEVLAGLTGEQTVPSVVLFASPLDHVVGEGARRQARLYPDQVCTLVKRRMGDVDWRFVAHGKAWSAPAVSALILKSLLADAAFGTGSGSGTGGLLDRCLGGFTCWGRSAIFVSFDFTELRPHISDMEARDAR